MEEREVAPEVVFQKRLELTSDLCVLREDKRALAGGEDGLQEVEETVQLAVAVAYQLEARKEREHVALAAFAGAIVGKRVLVLRPLLRGQRAVLPDFALRAELAGYLRVGLQPPQDERLDGACEASGGGAAGVNGDGSREADVKRAPVAEVPSYT